ncbi:hypothetical protein GCM10009624_05310 [Gordonia sinesedis]
MAKKLLLAAIGIGAIVLVLISGRQTLAQWSDAESVAGAQITSGTLDLTVGDDGSQVANYQFAALGKSGLASGQFVQAPLVIRNSGSTPLTFRLQQVAQSNAELPLTLRVTLVGATANCPATGEPTGSLLQSDVATTSAQVPTAPASRTLAVDAQEVWCFRVTVGNTAPASTSSTLTFTFRADQT